MTEELKDLKIEMRRGFEKNNDCHGDMKKRINDIKMTQAVMSATVAPIKNMIYGLIGLVGATLVGGILAMLMK